MTNRFQPNYRGVGEWLLGPECRRLVELKATQAQGIYRGVVAHRTGALAASADVSTYVGGSRQDRWVGRLTVGDGIDYGASHEFGTRHQRAHDDLNQVLTLMAAG